MLGLKPVHRPSLIGCNGFLRRQLAYLSDANVTVRLVRPFGNCFGQTIGSTGCAVINDRGLRLHDLLVAFHEKIFVPHHYRKRSRSTKSTFRIQSPQAA